ncbi:craniofacial development protein 2-like [Penaeus vannamei]|uniref:craniofacial development protein 2-like n=1 Tax=Penaeus vannamei TaxID=6689 RepID=UPI00387F6DE4
MDHKLEYLSISDRIAWIVVRLCKNTLKVIQAYAPTSQSSEDEIDSFYDDLSQKMDQEPTKYTLLIGDFNAEVGKQQNGETSVGEGRKWTWRSPNGSTKNEIFIIPDKDNYVQIVTVINKVNIGSDHIMVACTSKFKFKIRISTVNVTTDQSEIPKILPKEVEYALKNMKRGKAPGEDGILVDLLKDAREELHSRLAHLFPLMYKERTT